MRINVRAVLVASCAAALLAAVPAAKADVVSFSYWNSSVSGIHDGDSTPVQGSAVYSSAATVTGTITGGAGLINFYLPGIGLGDDSSLGGFLTHGYPGDGSNSDAVSSLGAFSGDNINDSVFQFSGDTELVHGQTYTFTHDDGMLLYISGVALPVINSGAPTVATASSFTWMGSTGTYSFTLDYDEVNGAPAVLSGSLDPAPEPSSFVLLGSSLLGAAGMLRRRMKKA